MTDVEGLPVSGSSLSVPVPDSVVATVMPAFDSESEEALALRYGRRAKQQQELAYEFSRDPALLHQFFELYQTECRTVPQLLNAEKEYDKKGHILIVRRGNLCVGGARISVRTPRQPKPLPMEIQGFKLEDHFPHLKQEGMRYGEWSRVVLLPEFRHGEVARVMLYNLYRKSAALGIHHIYGAAPKINLRVYRQHLQSYGIMTKLYLNIEVPPYPNFEEVKDYIIDLPIDQPSAVKDAHDLPDMAVSADEVV